MKLFSTSCDTIYLGWDAPLLPRAAVVLRERFAEGHKLDLQGLVCVLPTSRGVRRFSALLSGEAETHDLLFQPPEIITVGQLPERLYQPELPVALEFEQTLAWARVLREMHPDDLEPLVPVIPSPETLGPWLELAGTLRRLNEELAASRLSFAEVMEATTTDGERKRWGVLGAIYSSYQKELRDAGLLDPHAARREAVVKDRCMTNRMVALIGTSDLSDALVAMLRALNSESISLVAAPADAADRFDEFGCVNTSSWVEHELPLADEQLVTAGDISDQSVAVAESLQLWSGQFPNNRVTVGVTDDSQVGPVELELRGCGVSTYRNLGWTIPQTSVGRLLDLTSTFLQRQTWQSLAALVRHADVYASMETRIDNCNWLTQLDELLANHFPVSVHAPLPAEATKRYPLAVQLCDLVKKWLSIFNLPEQSIANWSQEIGRWLDELFDDSTSHRTSLALGAAKRVIDRFSKLNTELDLDVSGTAALEMLISRLSEVRVNEEPSSESTEILGWLDLPLDDSEALVVVGLNHPFVPGAVTNDPFLPGSLRTKLRMADNDRRYARDVYAMQVIISSLRAVRFIVGGTSADGSPTPPSRLLAASAPRDLARRIRVLLSEQRDPITVHHRWDQTTGDGRIPIPAIDDAANDPITSMSVTAFREYLECPYRFYLRRVLKLIPLEDASGELAANQFGDLVHNALDRFGHSNDCHESNRAKIEARLIEHLHDYAAQWYGDATSTAVTLQVAQAESRLRVVADVQAQRYEAGWRIHASEKSVDEKLGAGIEVEGRWMNLRGRIDRIDFHEPTGRWAILDYKTHGHPPEKKHLRQTENGHEWIDLQLPLYRMMIPFLGIDAPASDVELGYFNISEKNAETKINIANFDETQMAQAEDLIRQCIRRIWSGDFQPTSERVPFDDYGMILQTGVASRMLDQADEWLGEEVEA